MPAILNNRDFVTAPTPNPKGFCIKDISYDPTFRSATKAASIVAEVRTL